MSKWEKTAEMIVSAEFPPTPCFHQEECAVHSIVLSEKGGFSGVTTGITVTALSSRAITQG